MNGTDRRVLATIGGLGWAYGLDIWDRLPKWRRFGLYPSLNRLMWQGLIVVEFEPGTDPRRRAYRLTPIGSTALSKR